MKQKIKRILATLMACLIFSGSLPLSALAANSGSSISAIAQSVAQEPAADTPQSQFVANNKKNPCKPA